MKVIAAFISSFLILVGWHFFKPSRHKNNKLASTEEKREENKKDKHPYAAVKVMPCANACQPAQWVSSKVFLVADFPSLPIPSCDHMQSCACKFKHYDDRRQAQDRRSDSIILQNVYAGGEHRKKKKRGRRITDM